MHINISDMYVLAHQTRPSCISSFHLIVILSISYFLFNFYFNRVELREVLQRYGQGAHNFFNLRKKTLFLSFRDPMNFVDCPAAQSDCITVAPRKGNTKVKEMEEEERGGRGGEGGRWVTAF